MNRRKRAFFYLFTMIIISGLLSYIFTPKMIGFIVKRYLEYQYLNFDSMGFHVFKGIELTNLKYESDEFDLFADYVKMDAPFWDLMFGTPKINNLFISKMDLNIKKKGSVEQKIKVILKNFEILEGTVKNDNDRIKNLYMRGNFNSISGMVNITDMSAKVDIEDLFRDLNIVSLKGNIRWKKDITLNDIAITTPDSELLLNGNIGKENRLIIRSEKLDLSEIFYSVAMENKEDMKGIASGNIEVTIKDHFYITGNGYSDHFDIYDIHFKNTKVDLSYDTLSKKFNFNVIGSKFYGGVATGLVQYEYGKLNILSRIDGLSLTELLDIGIDITSSVNADVEVNGVFQDGSSEIDAVGSNLSGNIIQYEIDQGSNFTLRVIDEMKKLEKCRIFTKTGDLLDISAFEYKHGFDIVLNEIRYSPDGKGLFNLKADGKGSIHEDNIDISIFLESLSIDNDLFPEPVELNGILKINGDYQDPTIAFDITSKDLKLNIFTQNYVFDPVKIKGMIGETIDVHIEPVNPNEENDLKLSFDGDIKAFGKIKLAKIEKNGVLDEIKLELDIKSKNEGKIKWYDIIFGDKRIKDIVLEHTKKENARLININSETISGNLSVDEKRSINGEISLISIEIPIILDILGKSEAELVGNINLNAVVQGVLERPVIDLKFRVDNFARGNKYIGLFDGALSYEDEALGFSDLNIYHRSYNLKLSGVLPLTLSLNPLNLVFSDGDIDLDVELSKIEGDFLDYIMYDLPYIFTGKVVENRLITASKGEIDGSFKIGGSYDSAEFNGILKVNGLNMKFSYQDFQYDLSEFGGDLIFSSEESINDINIANCSFNVAQGSKRSLFKLNSFLSFDSEIIFSKMDIKISEGIFPINLDNAEMNLSELDLRFNYDEREKLIAGKVVINDSNVNYEIFNVIDFIVSFFERKRIKTSFFGEKLVLILDSDIMLDIDISTKNPMFFKGEDQNMFISMNRMNVNGTLQHVKLAGNLDIIDGTVFKFGNTYKFLPSVITFRIRDVIDPDIGLNLQSFISGRQINIEVKGTFTEPVVSLSSIPQLSDYEIISLILFRSVIFSEEGVNIFNYGLDIVLNEVAGEILKLTRKTVFGYITSILFDTLKIEKIGESIQDTYYSRWKFTMGKFLFSNLFVGYSRYEDSLYDQQLEFKFYINPRMLLSVNLNISPYENRSFGDSIYLMAFRTFNFEDVFKLRRQ